ncbi:MAG: ATP-grasp domain-containing protein [Desulfobulbales bacterium]
MSREKLVIRDNSAFRVQYNTLQAGDVVVGRLRLHKTEESLLVDLYERGIHLIPSGLSQLLSRSKSLQADVLAQYMLPFTRAIHSLHDLINTIADYQKKGVSSVVTKLDRSNAGMGVHLWQSVEEVFTHASLGNLPYPFVLQPYEPEGRDIRVVFLGEYVEAYWRHNPHNFRNNLHHGGQSRFCELTEKQLELCRQVMERGRFPYGHIDLFITKTDRIYLGEINLRGGLRGASITPEEYQTRIEAIHQKILNSFVK